MKNQRIHAYQRVEFEKELVQISRKTKTLLLLNQEYLSIRMKALKSEKIKDLDEKFPTTKIINRNIDDIYKSVRNFQKKWEINENDLVSKIEQLINKKQIKMFKDKSEDLTINDISALMLLKEFLTSKNMID